MQVECRTLLRISAKKNTYSHKHNMEFDNSSSYGPTTTSSNYGSLNITSDTSSFTVGNAPLAHSQSFWNSAGNNFTNSTGKDSDLYFGIGNTYVQEAILSFYYRYKDPQVAVLIALYILSFLLGLVGNLLVILIFTKNPKMRTVTNSFLVNLAVCDLLVVCLCMPIAVAYESYHNWIYGSLVCKIVNFTQGLSLSASIITLTVISAERFYAVNHPLKARAFMSKSRVIKIISGIWIISALIISPILIVRKEEFVQQIFSLDIYVCKEEWNTVTKLLYNISLCIILYVLPVVFICVGYLRIGISLWTTDSSLHAGSNHSRSARRTQTGRRKVAKMLFVMAILFMLSWLPFQVMSIAMDLLPMEILKKHSALIRGIFSYSVWLSHTNSSVNPICYCIMSQSFKKAIQYQVTHCCHGNHLEGGQTYFNQSLRHTVSTSGVLSRSRIKRMMSRSRQSGYKQVTNNNGSNNGALTNNALSGKMETVDCGSEKRKESES